MGAPFGNGFEGVANGLPPFETPSRDHRAAEKTELRSVPVPERVEFLGRTRDDHRVDVVPLGERLDRPEKQRSTAEVLTELVAFAEATTGAGGGNDQGASHGFDSSGTGRHRPSFAGSAFVPSSTASTTAGGGTTARGRAAYAGSVKASTVTAVP